jgi:glutamate carboxypeptidase
MQQPWDFNEQRQSAFKTLIQDLVLLESPSGDAARIRQVMERLVEEIAMVPNIEVEWQNHAGQPILELHRGRGGALMLGHADTVWSVGTIDSMPWREENTENGLRIYGPGILDMKAGLAMGLYAIRQLPEDLPFHFLVTPDEEVGSDASRSVIESRAREVDLVLVLESGMPGGALKTARSGVGDFVGEIVGVESHAGLDPDKGASAIREAAQQILWLTTLANHVLGTTVNVGTITGGTRTNVVAGQATMGIDVRVQTAGEMDRIESTLAHPPVFDKHIRVQYRGGFNRPPMESTPASNRWFDRARKIWRGETGEELLGLRVGGASDGNFTAALAPTLDGLGAIGRGAHARHEHIEWQFVSPRIMLIAELLRAAGSQHQ